MKRLIAATAIITFLLASAHFAKAQLQPTVDVSQYGWLEGTITNNQGQPVEGRQTVTRGKHISGIRQGGGEFEATSDLQMGGFYSAKNIKPGVYDITLEKGYVDQTPYCPERILGVVVKPGQRTVLNVVMDQGETYEEVGKPTFVTNLATNVTQQLEQMQKQIDDLKQQVAALQQKLGTTAAATPPATPTVAPVTPAKP